MTAVLRRNATTFGAYALAALIFLVGVVARSSFASATSLQQLVTFAAFVGIVALGQTFVILAGGFDLSVAWLVGLGGILCVRLTAHGLPGALTVLVIVLVGAAVGLVSGLGVAVLRVSPIVMTLATGGLVQAYLLSISLGDASSAAVAPVATDLAVNRVAGIPVLAIVWLALALVAHWTLRRTVLGRRLYATGSNDIAASIAGIRVGVVRTSTYVVSGASATFTGLVLAGYLGQAYSGMGAPYLFGSIAAVVVGGAAVSGGHGTYWGTVAGASTLTFLSALLPIFHLGQSTLDIVYGAVILVGVGFARWTTAFAGRAVAA